jgi:hypothetical protein
VANGWGKYVGLQNFNRLRKQIQFGVAKRKGLELDLSKGVNSL